MSALQSSFLGALTEICIVTPDHQKTMDGLLRLGIGPFQVFHFDSGTTHSQTFRGKQGNFELIVCFAKQGDLVFEIMQPVRGESLMAEYLDKLELIVPKHNNQEGIQHIAFSLGDLPMQDRKAEMARRGFEPAMEGVWIGKKGSCHFCFFDTEGAVGTVFETIDFSPNWEDPECVWYPEQL